MSRSFSIQAGHQQLASATTVSQDSEYRCATWRWRRPGTESKRTESSASGEALRFLAVRHVQHMLRAQILSVRHDTITK